MALRSWSRSSSTQTLGTTTYQYDTAGNLRRITDPLNQNTYSLYDANGRVIATIDAINMVAAATQIRPPVTSLERMKSPPKI